MTTRLKVVAEAPEAPLDAAIADAIAATMEEDASVAGLLANTQKSLAAFMDVCRRRQAAREAEIAAANAEYAKVEADARARRDARVAAASTDLAHLRFAMEHVEPCRASLAERS